MYEIRDSSIHGKGVFAKKLILGGTELSFPVKTYSDNIPQLLKPYLFPWDIVNNQKIYCICAVGSYMNHSNNPNIDIKRIDKKNKMITFVSLRDIKTNEELTLYYGEWAKIKFIN